MHPDVCIRTCYPIWACFQLLSCNNVGVVIELAITCSNILQDNGHYLLCCDCFKHNRRHTQPYPEVRVHVIKRKLGMKVEYHRIEDGFFLISLFLFCWCTCSQETDASAKISKMIFLRAHVVWSRGRSAHDQMAVVHTTQAVAVPLNERSRSGMCTFNDSGRPEAHHYCGAAILD